MQTFDQSIDFQDVDKIARLFSHYIATIEEDLLKILTRYETRSTALDEIERTHDLLLSLKENENYFQKKVSMTAVFMPCNQPLYSFACFAIVPALISEEVHVKAPESTKSFYKDMYDLLMASGLCKNIMLSSEKREDFLLRCSATYYNPNDNRRYPVCNAVIFTGSSKNAENVRKKFSADTLFIANGSGHNPIIISDDAEIDSAVEGVLKVGSYNQGQDCASPNSVLVDSTIYDLFLEKLKTAISNLRVGSYVEPEIDIGPISRPETLPDIAKFFSANQRYLDADFQACIDFSSNLVLPSIVTKELRFGGNFTEVYAPIFVIQKYYAQDDLATYFEDERYPENAMYITVYGTSDYLEKYLQTVGKNIHPNESIVRNTHLHEKGVERGVKQYGGYGNGASSITFNNSFKAMPTLPQRDIYNYLIKKEKLVDKSLLKTRLDSSPIIHKRKVARLHWSDSIAKKIVESSPFRDEYVCASAISPSGKIHFGNFRDVYTAYAVHEALIRMGKSSSFVFRWDDHDALRRVPTGLSHNEFLKEEIGKPLSNVQLSKGSSNHFIQDNILEFEKSLLSLGINPTITRASSEYSSGTYDEQILIALRNRTLIADILLEKMSYKTKISKSINDNEFRKNYFPLIVYSTYTGKNNTRVLSYDGDSSITYKCFDSGKTETIDITKRRCVKLVWKVDWAAKWARHSINFEPGGHDHASPGGSYDVAKEIAKRIYGITPPYFQEYKFVSCLISDQKMSSSKGDSVNLSELLSVYPVEIVKWFYATKLPKRSFCIKLDEGVFNVYKQHQLHTGHRLLVCSDNTQNSEYLTFRQSVGLGRSTNWNVSLSCYVLQKRGYSNVDQSRLKTLLQRSRYWSEKYSALPNPYYFNRNFDSVYIKSLKGIRKMQITDLANYLYEADELNYRALETILYNIPKQYCCDVSKVQSAQKTFFEDIYSYILHDKKGPRVATMLCAIGIDALKMQFKLIHTNAVK